MLKAPFNLLTDHLCVTNSIVGVIIKNLSLDDRPCPRLFIYSSSHCGESCILLPSGTFSGTVAKYRNAILAPMSNAQSQINLASCVDRLFPLIAGADSKLPSLRSESVELQ